MSDPADRDPAGTAGADSDLTSGTRPDSDLTSGTRPDPGLTSGTRPDPQPFPAPAEYAPSAPTGVPTWPYPPASQGFFPPPPAQPPYGATPAGSPYPVAQAPQPYPAPPGGGAWIGQPAPGPGTLYPPGWPAAPARTQEKPSALPVEAREYHEFFRAPRFRWWKPILSLLMFGALFFAASLVLPGIALAVDIATGRLQLSDLNGPADEVIKKVMTPLGFTANNVALALSIPAAGLTAWAVHGQRPRWMSSIAGGFRWGLLGRFALVAGPIFLLSFGLDIVLGGLPEFRWNADSTFLILAVLVTTPFQAAGEEYALRGLVARAVGSWFSWRRLGLVVAAVLSSLVFMLLHNANNPWLNTYYFSVGMICSVLAWRTGGLEAPVALHVCNNLVSEITLPFGGLATMFDRGPDSAGPLVLVQLAFTLSVMAGMLWLSHRLGLARTAAPARPEPPSVQEVFWNSSHTIA